MESDEKFQIEMKEIKEEAKAVKRDKADAKELLTREAHAYVDSFSRIQGQVKKIAKAHKIKLVLRANTEPVDRDDRASVLKRINNNVIFHERLDLTKMVVNALEKEFEREGNEKQNQARLPTASPGSLINPTSDRKPIYCDQCGGKLEAERSGCDCKPIVDTDD